LWVGYLVDADIAHAMEHNRFHFEPRLARRLGTSGDFPKRRLHKRAPTRKSSLPLVLK
jgi:hypothetical protein